jgi:hypothetical protein
VVGCSISSESASHQFATYIARFNQATDRASEKGGDRKDRADTEQYFEHTEYISEHSAAE